MYVHCPVHWISKCCQYGSACVKINVLCWLNYVCADCFHSSVFCGGCGTKEKVQIGTWHNIERIYIFSEFFSIDINQFFYLVFFQVCSHPAQYFVWIHLMKNLCVTSLKFGTNYVSHLPQFSKKNLVLTSPNFFFKSVIHLPQFH